jgi:hypothetical protein
MARGRLLFFSFPLEVGLCPHIAGSALSPHGHHRAGPSSLALIIRVFRVRGRSYPRFATRAYGSEPCGLEDMHL